MIHLACNIDHRYVRHCGVMLASALRHTTDAPVTLHVVGRGLTEGDRSDLEAIARPAGARLRYYTPGARLLDGFTIRATHNRLSLTAYYRCFLSDLLPAEVERVIYLDCDLLVLQSLTPLWQVDLHGASVAAADDVGCREAERYERLGYPPADSYFNSGVLLIDLARWRAAGMGRRSINYYNSHSERIVYNDQDVLNGLLHDDKVKLDLKWNVQDGFYRRRCPFSCEWQAAHADMLRHPAILHYTNRKPWDYESQHPLRHLYFEYLDLTPWRGERPWHNPLNLIKRCVRLLPFRLRLRHPRYIDIDKL